MHPAAPAGNAHTRRGDPACAPVPWLAWRVCDRARNVRAGGHGLAATPTPLLLTFLPHPHSVLSQVSLRPGSLRRWTVGLPFAGVAASLGALATWRPAIYARHRTLTATGFRLAYAFVANAAIAGAVAREGVAADPAPSHLRFWAERSNPVVLAMLGLTSGLGAGPLAALCAGQLALLSAWVGPACAALEARHPSHPGRFADASAAFSTVAGGLLATLVGDAATLVDLTGVGGAGGGGGGGGGGGSGGGAAVTAGVGGDPGTVPSPLPPSPLARTCPHRTCVLVMTQLYLTAFVVAIVTTLAGDRRRRAAAAGAAPAPGGGGELRARPWWVVTPIDRHARAAVVEAGAAMFGAWLLLKAVDGWWGCPA